MDLDPELIQQIQGAGDRGEVEALILVSKDPSDGLPEDSRGPAGRLIDRAVEQTHEEPIRVRYLPKLGAVFVRGTGRLVNHLLKQAEVTTATTNGISTRG